MTGTALPGTENTTCDTYLMVADQSPEFLVALHYTAKMAAEHNARIGFLSVMEEENFHHWGGIQNRLQREQRAEKEQILWNAAKKLKELNGMTPILYLEEGAPKDELLKLINKELDIKMLVLGANTENNKAGRLVSHFTGKGLSTLRVPVLVVPSHIES